MIPLDDSHQKMAGAGPENAREELERRQQSEALNAAISKLPPELREVVLLHYCEGLSQKEIATRLELHPSTVGRQLQKALATMKSSLEPILRESGPALRPPKHAVVRALALVAASGALSTSVKAALIAETSTLAVAAATAAHGSAGAGVLGKLITTGANIMGIGKGLAIAGVAAAAIFVGVVMFKGSNETLPPTEPRKVSVPSVALAPEETQQAAIKKEEQAATVVTPQIASQAQASPPTVQSLEEKTAAAQTAALQVKVLDWRGEPASGVPVSVAFPFPWPSLKAQTDLNGEAKITLYSAADYTVITARADYGVASAPGGSLSLGTTQSLTLKLASSATIRGRVTISEKEPCPGVLVIASASAPRTRQEQRTVRRIVTESGQVVTSDLILSSGGRLNLGSSYETVGEATTDEQGYYEITPTIAGPMRIMVSPVNDEKFLSPPPKDIVLAPDKDAADVDFSVQRADFLEGVVLSSTDRQPVKDAQIGGYLRSTGNTAIPMTTSGPDGKFRLAGVPYGEVIDYLYVTHPDFDPKNLEQINPLSGPLEILMVPNKKAVLVALDGQTGEPIPHYRYRILRETYRGLNPDLTQDNPVVNNPAGEVSLKGFDVKQSEGFNLVAEVVELDPSENPTGRRGAQPFSFAKSDEDKRVEVRVLNDILLRGVVVDAATSNPVGYASVGVEPMRDSWNHSTIPLDLYFDPPDTESESDGQFQLGPILPGRYTLRVEKDGLKPDPAVVVEIPADREPDEIKVALGAHAVIFGRVAYKDGEALGRVKVTAKGWIPGSIHNPMIGGETDSSGDYRLENLQGGEYEVSFPHGVAGQDQSVKKFLLASGEKKEVNFEVDRSITLKGKITVGGRDISALGNDRPQFHLLPAGGGTRIAMGPSGSGDYEVRVLPATYQATVGNLPGWFWRGIVDEVSGGIFGVVTVTDQPDTQYKDFDLALTSAEIIVEVPESQEFMPGVVEISQRIGEVVRDRLCYQPISGPTARIDILPPGEYKAYYRSKDNSRLGESDWTRVEVAADNSIAILMSRKEKVRIGGWNPQALSTGDLQLNINMAPFLQGSGMLEILFDYESGLHGARITGVTLLKDGDPISSDPHSGWAGGTEVGNTFHLALSDFNPASTYTLVANIIASPKNQADSTGSIYLVRDAATGSESGR